MNEGISIISECVESDELQIFEVDNFQNLLKFKWEGFTKNLHFRGCFFHFFYTFTLMVFINKVYIQNDTENNRVYQYLLCVGIIYPFWYETLQLYRSGFKDYFSDINNYLDLLYIYGGLINVIH